MKRIATSFLFIAILIMQSYAQAIDDSGEVPGYLVKIETNGQNFLYQAENTYNGKCMIYHKFTVGEIPMVIKLNCYGLYNALYEFSILDEQKNVLIKNASDPSVQYTCRPGRTYYALANIYGSNMQTTIFLRGYKTENGHWKEPVFIGTFSSAFEYYYPFDTSLFSDDPSASLRKNECFAFSLEKSMELNFMTSNSMGTLYDTKVVFYDKNEDILTSVFCQNNIRQTIVLPPGDYRITVEGRYANGEIELNMRGDAQESPEQDNNCAVQYRYNLSGHRIKTIQKP